MKRHWQLIPAVLMVLVLCGLAYGPGLWRAAWEPYNAAWWQAGWQAGHATAKENEMATSWYVGKVGEVGTDPGDATYKGLYVESGTYGGKPAYTLDATHWLFWWGPSNWALGPSPGIIQDYYGALSSADLPANPWTVNTGTPPAPTVSEVATFSITGRVTR